MKTLLLSFDDLKEDLDTRFRVFLKVADIVKKGGLVVYPTDTVYGIGGNPFNSKTIKKILNIKDRPVEKGLPILIGNIDILREFAHITPLVEEILNRVWPGPVTFVLPKVSHLPGELTGERKTIAIRMPNHSLLLELLHKVGGALIGTSANISGKAPLNTKSKLVGHFNQKVDVIITQSNPLNGIPSSVIDLTGKSPQVIREGSLTIPWLTDYNLK